MLFEPTILRDSLFKHHEESHIKKDVSKSSAIPDIVTQVLKKTDILPSEFTDIIDVTRDIDGFRKSDNKASWLWNKAIDVLEAPTNEEAAIADAAYNAFSSIPIVKSANTWVTDHTGIDLLKVGGVLKTAAFGWENLAAQVVLEGLRDPRHAFDEGINAMKEATGIFHHSSSVESNTKRQKIDTSGQYINMGKTYTPAQNQDTMRISGATTPVSGADQHHYFNMFDEINTRHSFNRDMAGNTQSRAPINIGLTVQNQDMVQFHGKMDVEGRGYQWKEPTTQWQPTPLTPPVTQRSQM